MKSEDTVTKRPCLGWDEPGGHKQVSQGCLKAKVFGYSEYLKIIAFLTLSMIINIYFPGASEG